MKLFTIDKMKRIILVGLGIIFIMIWLVTTKHLKPGMYERTAQKLTNIAGYYLAKAEENLLCIEDNICKEHPNDQLYIYKRKQDFIQRIDDNISDVLNIEHSTYVVPNIVHFVQYTDISKNKTENDFQFHHMLSVLSAYKIQKPNRIYFWLDREPRSKYWIKLKQMVPMNLIYRERPTSIRGKRVHFITKISNVIRMEAIIEYGGMYFDLDVLVVNSLEPLRRYDATMGKEARDMFCNAIIIGKPWADFLRKWHQEHKSLNENIWSYHSGKVPFLLAERFPSLVHVEERSFFRPAYYEINYLYKEGQLFDWRKNNFCVHIWIRFFHEKRRTDSEIDRWNTTVGEMYRYILYGDSSLR